MPSGSARPEAAVFAPSPLLEIVLEPAPEEEVHLHAGGQGFWIARMMSSLGVKVRLCATFGGETGAVIRSVVEQMDLGLRAVDSGVANGCTIEDRRSGEVVEVIRKPPGRLGRHELDDLYGIMLVESMAAGLAVLGGHDNFEELLDASVYERLARDLRANGCFVIADLSGEAMEAVLAGGLDVLKVSSDELQEMGLVKRSSPEELRRAMKELHKKGAGHVVVTRAEEGVIALLDERVVELPAPELEAVDPRGAGDSLTGGLAAGIARGDDLAGALRLGVAAGALNATRHGLASGTREEIERLAERVEVTDES